ncbi:MAG: tRNA preQ1(34) S-adenosylmethionine ribosyltransferase-isomerase QueA, partial [Candidatus Omnitrophota bacterium]
MKLSEFDYILPKELIAQYPVSEREKCRLLVQDRQNSSLCDKIFSDIIGYFNKGDCIVLNDTRVIPARLFGKRSSGGKVELFVLEKKWPILEALVRPSARLKDGEEITLESGDKVEILGRGDVGRFVKFERPIDEVLSDAGHVPLPPYIARTDDKSDKEAYQTVYSSKEGATASPTAGLHFTKALLDELKSKGVSIVYVTLHTSYGTFAPVKSDDITEHKMHKEYFELSSATIEAIRKTKESGAKVFAVGTTSARVLEYCAD